MKPSFVPPRRAACLVALILASLAAPAADKDQDNDAGLRRPLLGKWSGAVVEGDPARPGATRYSLRELVITPEKITAHDTDGRYLGTGSYTVSRGTDGRLWIDATGLEGPSRGQRMLGIWRVEGDTLHWCSGNNGHARPSEFRTRTPGAYLLVLKRKPE